MADVEVKDINNLQDKDLDSGNLLQTIHAVKQIWKGFMKMPVLFLSHNDRVAAMRSHFKKDENVTFPLAYMFETSVAYDESLRLPAKNLARSGTGKGIVLGDNTATISKSFLLPATITFDFIVFFDNDYEAIKWKERALLYLASRSLGAIVKYKDFTYDLHQMEAVNEISTPQREPDQVPHPDATEYTVSITFRTKIGNVEEVAKVNNEGLLKTNLNIVSGEGEELFAAEVKPNLTTLSRKQIHQELNR